MRILFAHLLVMGIMKRGNAAKYWSNCDITKLDFFGKYLSRNSYQMMLSNFHCAPNSVNPLCGRPGHDPLHKIRPLMTMCLSVDKGGCGFRGKVKFLTHNKDKPNKWSIKLELGVRALTQKMDLCVGWTYIVGKMLHCVQRMHQLRTLNAHKQLKLLCT